MSRGEKTPGGSETHPATWGWLGLFTLAYLGCAELGRFLSFQPGSFAIIGPASGLLLAVLVVRPARTWPPFLAGSLAASLVSDLLIHAGTPTTSLAFWAVNAAEACAGAYLLRGTGSIPFRCSSPQQVLRLAVFSALLSTMIAASVGTLTLSVAGIDEFSWDSWRMRCGADALGILVVAPLLLSPGEDYGADSGKTRLLRIAEFLFILTALLAIANFSFGRSSPLGGAIWRLPYSYTAPFLLWCGVRLGQRAASLTALCLVLLISWHTTRGRGPLAWLTQTHAERAMLLHIFLGSVVITSLILASAVAHLRGLKALLSASEDAYRSLAAFQKAILDSANYTIISTNPAGTILSFNAAAERRLGYEAAELVGKQTPAAIHDPEEVAARAAELTAELGEPVEPGFDAFVAKVRMGGADERDWTYVRADGGRFPVRLSVTALRNGAGTITGFLGIGIDITAEKSAREEVVRAHQELETRVAARTEELAFANEMLRERERAFRQLADAMPQIVWAARLDGYVDYYNDRWYEFTGFDRHGGGDESWKPIIHPDDLDACLSTWYRSIATGEPYELEYRYRDRRTGLYCWHLGRALPVRDETGRITRWYGTSTDIDHYKRTEEALRASQARQSRALSAARLGHWELDLLTGKIGYIDGMQSLYGRPDDQPFEDFESVMRAVVPEDLEPIREAMDRSIRDDVPLDIEFRVAWPDGSIRWLAGKGAAFRDPAGVPYHLAGVNIDITEKKEAEAAIRDLNADLERRVATRTEELVRAKAAAEAASQAKGEFLANMSHEIRTPMNGILGTTELLLGTTLSTRQREYLGLVKTSADSLLDVINDILDFSKIEAGKLTLSVAPFALRDSIMTTLHTLNLRAHDRGIELACRIDPDLPEAVLGDLGRLRQVLVNLVGNAIKFTKVGEVVVSIEPVPDPGEDLVIRCSVADTGIGVPLEKRELIFAAFEQADGSTTRQFGGTGLGLTISSRLVDLMGGTIWVEENPGGGSIFRFTARLRPASESLSPPRKITNSSLSGLRVLVVDDSSTNRMILEEMLRRLDLSVMTARGGTEALDQMELAERAGDPFDALLLDHLMPEISGIELARKIRSEPRYDRIGILVLSSGGDTGAFERLHDLRIDGFLLKPIHSSELQNALVRMLRGGPEAAPSNPTVDPKVIADGNRLSVLLAEDHPVNQIVASRMLEAMGHEVRIAGNGRLAVEAWSQQTFDLILMDVQMPEMDGFEAVAAIRGQESLTGKHTRIFALTAHAMTGDRERCLNAGFDDYLTKPINSAKLGLILEKYESHPPKPPSKAEPSEDDMENAPGLEFDFDEALASVDGDVPLLTELLGLFFEDCPKQLEEARTAAQGDDAPTLARIGHTIVGIGDTFAARRVATAARGLEAAAKPGETRSRMTAIDDLDEAIARFREAVGRLDFSTTIPDH